ncbi:MAG: hypothetical protein MZW92_79875 [Comamonadaceae bacterium]|nr:hypothetical protein [Comamonadaceae bacterium]
MLGAASLGLFCAARLADRPALVLSGAGHDAPQGDGAGAGAVRAGAAGVHCSRSRRSMSQFSRRHEFEADAYAARQTRARATW